MSRSGPTFTIGMEEEYLLVERETRDLAVDVPEDLEKVRSLMAPKAQQTSVDR